MKNILFIMLGAVPGLLFAQTAAPANAVSDSLKILYQKYYELERQHGDLRIQYGNLSNTAADTDRRLTKVIIDKDITTKKQFDNRKSKIVNTAHFVEAANTSLNSIRLVAAVGDYLNEINTLNNPTTTELGFSLSNEIKKVLDRTIIKSTDKLNGSKTAKFLSVVDNIIQSPIVTGVANAIPVVGSIKSVVDLVMGVAVRGKDVSVDDITNLKKALGNFILHYEGLNAANGDFVNTLNTLGVRREAVSLLLRQYIVERLNTLEPGGVPKDDVSTISDLIFRKYNRDRISTLIDQIELVANPPNPEAYTTLFSDPRFAYPSYAESQAGFIRDEILSIAKEYIAAYTKYQGAVEKVLTETQNNSIGDPVQIKIKIEKLREKLKGVEVVFSDNINTEELNRRYQLLLAF